jgi:hypothetical protein
MTRYIDADAIDKMYVPIAPVLCGDDVHYEWVAFVEDINELPTVDAEPVRHGKWIEYPTADGMNQCSACGILRFGESNYCPNCGARMDEK